MSSPSTSKRVRLVDVPEDKETMTVALSNVFTNYSSSKRVVKAIKLCNRMGQPLEISTIQTVSQACIENVMAVIVRCSSDLVGDVAENGCMLGIKKGDGATNFKNFTEVTFSQLRRIIVRLYGSDGLYIHRTMGAVDVQIDGEIGHIESRSGAMAAYEGKVKWAGRDGSGKKRKGPSLAAAVKHILCLELPVYRALPRQQSHLILTLIAAVHPDTGKATEASDPGALGEFCAFSCQRDPARLHSRLRLVRHDQSLPCSSWQRTVDQPLAIIHTMSDRLFLDKDSSPKHFIVRSQIEPKSAVLTCLIIDFGHCRFRRADESDFEGRRTKRNIKG